MEIWEECMTPTTFLYQNCKFWRKVNRPAAWRKANQPVVVRSQTTPPFNQQQTFSWRFSHLSLSTSVCYSRTCNVGTTQEQGYDRQLSLKYDLRLKDRIRFFELQATFFVQRRNRLERTISMVTSLQLRNWTYSEAVLEKIMHKNGWLNCIIVNIRPSRMTGKSKAINTQSYILSQTDQKPKRALPW
jgi:hypothetical protein